MKQATWDNPNKMHMDSGFKLFDKQTNLISTGNVMSNTQRSFFIAPWNETSRNGKTDWEPGHLCKADMHFGRFDGDLPKKIREILFDKDRKESVILYAFRVWKKDYEDVFGYVVTNTKHEHIYHTVVCEGNCSYHKRDLALQEAMKYVCA